MNHIQERSSRPNNFILRAYEMVNNPKYSDVIGWTETGYSFAILNVSLFSSVVLPTYFKHKNISSFIRQLNMYGFHKERDTGEIQIFAHPCFIRGHRDILNQIRLKVAEDCLESRKPSSTRIKCQLKRSKRKFMRERLCFIEKSIKDILIYNQSLVAQISKCIDREQKVESFLMILLKQFKEIPSSLETCYMNILGPKVDTKMDLHFKTELHLKGLE